MCSCADSTLSFGSLEAPQPNMGTSSAQIPQNKTHQEGELLETDSSLWYLPPMSTSSAPSPTSVLIVDDEKNILSTLSRALRVEGFDVDVAGNAEIAFEKVAKKSYELIMLDVQLPTMNGLDILRKLRSSGDETPVIMMSGHGTSETAVMATKEGAYTFLDKPISTDHLLLSISNCLGFTKLADENRDLKQATGATSELLGNSAAMNRLKEQIELAADSRASILIQGERGTGKELVARSIHLASKRAEGPLEKLNCAAVPNELIESELFGHEAGAFTGATKQRKGKFERAHKGTLFLDEVGDMPSNMQAKLLRVLQEGELERVGGASVIKIDVRVVAATNKPLETEISEGRFRADLYDRLNVLPLQIPPLRERVDDVTLLCEEFLNLACKANDRKQKTLSKGALKLLRAYNYPGNVRELRNLIERLVILTTSDDISESEARSLLPIAGKAASGSYFQPGKSLKSMADEAERDIVLRALAFHENHITKTAASLGLERSHLYKKMKALGINREGSK